MTTSGEDLKMLIEKWVAENPETRDQGYLERKSGVPYSTINRIWHGRNPDCQTALAILHIVGTRIEARTYLQKHFPLALPFHEAELTVSPVFSDAELIRPLLANTVSFVIANLAYAEHGQRSKIYQSFGYLGIEAAEKLVSSKTFHWKNDQLTPSNPENFFSYENKEDLVKACQHIVALSTGKKGFPTVSVGSLNDQELSQFTMLIREFCSATRELVMSSKGGPHVVALATVFVALAGAGEEAS